MVRQSLWNASVNSSRLIRSLLRQRQTSLSPRAADTQKGSNTNMHPKDLVWLCEGGSDVESVVLPFRPCVRGVLQFCRTTSGCRERPPFMGKPLRAHKGGKKNQLKCIHPNTPHTDWLKPVHPKNKEGGKKCCIESILTSRTEILVLPLFVFKCGFLISSWDLPDPCYLFMFFLFNFFGFEKKIE